MYLGQESWTAARAVPRVSSQPAPPVQPRGEVGDATHISVSGCRHAVVGPIVCGNYTLTTVNHGRPAYKKEQQQGQPDVLLYFWDERDGAASSGWWLSPKIGSEVVWGFHPNRGSQTPPTNGWKVPYDGGVDPNFLISIQRRPQGGRAPAPPAAVGRGTSPAPVAGAPRIVGAPPTLAGGIRLNGAAEARRREAQMGDAKRQQDEVNKKRIEDQRRRMEEVRKQQEEAAVKRKEEQQKKLEEMKKQQEVQREEQRAQGAIRMVLQKLRTAKPEDFESLEGDLRRVLEKEHNNCGSKKAAMKEECDKGLEVAKQRVALLKEQKRKMEERRAEDEKRRKEASEAADKLLAELENLVDDAETAAERLKEASTKFEGDSAPSSPAEVAAAAKAVEELGKAFQSKADVAATFVALHRNEMLASSKGSQAGVLAPKVGQNKDEASDDKPALGTLQGRLQACNVESHRAISSTAALKDKMEGKISAQALMEQGRSSFKKYDKDKDGALSKQEVQQFAKGECDFSLPSESLDLIFQVIVKDGAKGVRAPDVQRLKVMVGIAREKARDVQRREVRLKKEQELTEEKAKLEEQVKEIVEAIEGCEEALKAAESLVRGQALDAKAQEVLDHASLIDEALKKAKELVAAAQEKVAALNDVDAADHKPFLRGEMRKLQRRMGSFEGRVTKVSAWLKKSRSGAKKRAVEELEALRAAALAAIRRHQQQKELKAEALLAEFAADGAGGVQESDFLKFFSRYEEERSKAADAAEKRAGEQAAAEKDKKKEEGEDAEAESPAPCAPSEAELRRLFAHLCEDGQKSIPREDFTRFLRRFMKVAKETILSEGVSIKEKLVRRLQPKEVVEILEGPVREESAGLMRVRARAMSDGASGWATVSGNKSSVYLEEGGGTFKVVKETILTDTFELAAAKDATRKLHDTTRKLAPGELVEVHEWPRLEEASGLTRMKGRAKLDGQVGWVTTVGNQGGVLLEVL